MKTNLRKYFNKKPSVQKTQQHLTELTSFLRNIFELVEDISVFDPDSDIYIETQRSNCFSQKISDRR